MRTKSIEDVEGREVKNKSVIWALVIRYLWIADGSRRHHLLDATNGALGVIWGIPLSSKKVILLGAQ